MKYDAVRALPCPEPLTAYSTAPRRLGMLIGCLALVGLGWNALGAERITKGDVQYEIDDTPAWVTPADLSMDDGSPARDPGTTRHRCRAR